MRKTLVIVLLLAAGAVEAADAPSAGLRVYRDPKTGVFTDRPRDEAQKALDEFAPVEGPNYDTLQYEMLDDGGVIAKPTEDQFHSAVRATVTADGTLQHDCAQGPAHVHEADRP